jgi:hypothetical protein
MGSNTSKETEALKNEINQSLSTYMPIFLETYCHLKEDAYMDPIQFWIGFQSFLRAQKINVSSELYQVKSDWVKYYFHSELNSNKHIYVTGAPSYNVLVGVCMNKWPGTYETDTRAQREDKYAHIF